MTIDYNKKCKEIRRMILSMLEQAGSGHAGGSLSAVEILVSLYYGIMRNVGPSSVKEERDHFILSKGHAAPALYAVLADIGYFPQEELKTLRKFHSRLQGHPDSKKLPGIEISTGSLGQGVSVAGGLALSIKMRKREERVYVLVGDGETEEGIVWEAAELAAQHALDNLWVVIDRNRIQLDGFCKNIITERPLPEKYRAFGFDVQEVDGHDVQALLSTFRESTNRKGRPHCIIANTIKGKGVSFMENQVAWHGKGPNATELALALEELKEE